MSWNPRSWRLYYGVVGESATVFVEGERVSELGPACAVYIPGDGHVLE